MPGCILVTEEGITRALQNFSATEDEYYSYLYFTTSDTRAASPFAL